MKTYEALPQGATPSYTKWFTPATPIARTVSDTEMEPQVVKPGDILVQNDADHGRGIPSPGVTETYGETFTIPNAVDEDGNELTIKLTVDYDVEDWGTASLDNNVIIDLSPSKEGSDEPTYGGHTAWSESKTVPVSPGEHALLFWYQNINIEDESRNLSICKYSYYAKAYEKGGVAEPEPCGCGGDTCSLEGGQENAAARSLGSVGSSSSAGSAVTCSITEERMLWSCNTANLRGLGATLSGKVQLYADTFSEALASPASLTFDHPMQASLVVPEGGAVRGCKLEIHKGSRVIALRYCSNGYISPVGVDTAGHGMASPILAEDGSLSSLKWQDDSGAAWFFDGATGALERYISPEGVPTNNVDSFMRVKRSADGALSQIWSYWDGLLNIEDISETGYRIALYTANQVSGPDDDGCFSPNEGEEPFKTFTFCYSESGLNVAEHSLGLEDYTCTWSQEEGGGWCLVRGTGADAIVTSKVRSVVEPVSASNAYEVWQVVTTISKGGSVASCTCDIYQDSPMGNLLLTHVEGYGSTAAQTTTYEYDGAGNVVKETAPNGHCTTCDYDITGRILRRIEPWGDGSYRQITEYKYSYYDSARYSGEPSEITLKLNSDADNSKTTLLVTSYTRTDADGIHREVRERVSYGFPHTLQEITETWNGDAPNALDRGRLRMTQAENGVQTWYSYEETSLHGAIYAITQETKVDGEYVLSHSTRRISYINAAGNTVRAEEWVLLYNGEWALISGESYSYDVQNRRIATQKDNGRSSSASFTCKGQLLHAVDENGIRTDYAYDSARQLIEITRAAVTDADGETIITPESITEYTRDGAGRALTTKVHTGAMLTQSSAIYDLAGRITGETDSLGRSTTYAYSADGLTTTVTQPNGATLITTYCSDGKEQATGGTGQPARRYRYDVAASCERTRTFLGDGESLVSERYVNGLGQEVISTVAHPGGITCTRSSYDAKGRLAQKQQDAGLDENGTPVNPMAPILYSYGLFGNIMRETIALADEPNASNSRLTLYAHSKLQEEDGGIYSMVTTTHNNSAGGAYNSSTATLISALSPTLESKSITTDARGKVSSSWVEYGAGAIRTQKEQLPTSSNIASTRMVDGFAAMQTDHSGIITSQSRSYGSTGITLTQTDGRGNTTTTQTDLAGRTVSVTDAAGATTTTAYCTDSDLPATITNAQGKTTCYRYDAQGHKLAEWGTATQPAAFGYDAEGRLTSLTTYRADEGDISTDPTGRSDGDTTQWSYHPASGLELRKTYADGSCITKTYDSFGRFATETNARGITRTFSYLSTTGELSGIVYSDGSTPAQAFSYTLTGKLASVTDAAGTRAFTYNENDELVTDSLTVDNETHLITETRDEFGRSVGFAYAKAGTIAAAEQYGYGTDGRLATAAFQHGDDWQTFSYGYLEGSNLLHTLTMPNGMSLTQQFEEKRDLLTGMEYKRGTSGVVERYYSYDTLGRPLTRQQNRLGGSRSDTFTHNDRGELTAGILGTKGYYYSYDNIGNRKTAKEDADEVTNYDANALNQYTAVGNFVPEFDADGNQTKVQTCTGIWNVTYNAENRPVIFSRSNEDGTTTCVTCSYDYMGRRATKKVESISAPDAETGESTTTATLHQRYFYRGYLQIACCDLTRENHPHLWLITWDPTQRVATRPLAIRKDGTWYCYGWDLTKNVCEVFSNEGYLNNTVVYSYTPYGAVTAEGSVTQPIQWSSEFNDEELGLVYYNYRHYNPDEGRWIGRDIVEDENKLYTYVGNNSFIIDILGLWGSSAKHWHHVIPKQVVKNVVGVSRRVINKIKECLNKQNFNINSAANGVMVDAHIHLSDMHGKGKWNQRVIADLLEVIKCCKDDDFNNFFNKWKSIAQKEYGAVPAEKGYYNRYEENSEFDLLIEGSENASNKIVYNFVEDFVKEQLTIAALKTVAKVALKIAIKKVPVVGWGYAAYGAVKGYQKSGIYGAIKGFLI